jgi:hypothetical protein
MNRAFLISPKYFWGFCVKYFFSGNKKIILKCTEKKTLQEIMTLQLFQFLLNLSGHLDRSPNCSATFLGVKNPCRIVRQLFLVSEWLAEMFGRLSGCQNGFKI